MSSLAGSLKRRKGEKDCFDDLFTSSKRVRNKSLDLERSSKNGMDLKTVKGDPVIRHLRRDNGSAALKPLKITNGASRADSTVQEATTVKEKIDPRKVAVLLLEKLTTHEVMITAPAKNLREITYVGLDESNTSDAKGVLKYTEYREEKFPALPRKSRDESSESRKGSPVVLRISPDFTFLFSINGYHDDAHSIFDVLSGQKMSTTVLDAFLSRRIVLHNALANSEKESPKATRPPNVTFQYLSLLFLPVYATEQDLKTYTPNMSLFPSGSLKDCILIAPQYVCKHYYLTVFNFPAKTIYVYDSCWNYVQMQYRFDQIRNVLKGLTGGTLGENGNKEESWDVFYVDKCAQQTDEVNCGCFVIYFAENELKGKSYKNEMKLNNKDLLQVRQEIIREILPSTSVGSKFLDAISM